ncbi:uncharacterized protein K452DRAFT_288319 [Aplosporella prunicola CBS 121167]|uniref:LYR motif-containing protein 2 n=1 Tax=Aplosporella prunicola CBS 121167 TaxID=1176127 RepID=A0A6A6BCF2_9PEZI|nr:uncharacterized protein K452DRAFT_288319 [Aplosporella prunicola CBS 121167]KAF2140914.1 hypothetical protein K452DRAFT_288319 [Aplosporella prunicola CBS 121167]
MLRCRQNAYEVFVRGYASVAGKPSRLRGAKGTFLGLEHFIQSKRALSLWREIVRALNKIPPSSTKSELRKFARDEFERNRHVSDITHIRYLISTGKTEFDSMKRYIEEQAL